MLTPLGIEANGAKRWLGVGGATIQPAEIAKFACILITAKLIEKRYDNIKSFTKGVLPLLIVPGTFFILIMGQPNMSTAGTIILVVFVMLFVAGMNMKFVYTMIALGIAAFAGLVISAPYRLDRVTSFLDPFKDPLGSGYQVIQSLYAIGSGGLFGLGLGKSKQKYFYIPEPQNDFIFAIIGEELGLIGCIVVMMLFLILVYRCIRIALKCSDIFSCMVVIGIGAQIGIQELGLIGCIVVMMLFLILVYRCIRIALKCSDIFSCMVVIGIGAQIGIQAALNIAVATSSMPATGVALPFISMGGTSLTILMGAVGIVLNISKHVKIN